MPKAKAKPKPAKPKAAKPARPQAKAKAKPQPAKPKSPAVHTVPHGDGWANRRDGSSRVAKVFGRKADAQAAGRQTARRERTEHVIHNRDGSVGSRNSYGNDPHPPKG